MQSITLSNLNHSDLAQALASTYPNHDMTKPLVIRGVEFNIHCPYDIAMEDIPVMLFSREYLGDIILSSDAPHWLDELGLFVDEWEESQSLPNRLKAAGRDLESLAIKFIANNATGIKTGLEVSSAIYSTVTMIKAGGSNKLGFWSKLTKTYSVPALAATTCILVDRIKEKHERRTEQSAES